MRVDTGEKYTVKQATQHAFLWCQNNPGWKRICDIENSDSLYFTWDELPKKIRKQWKKLGRIWRKAMQSTLWVHYWKRRIL